MSVQEEKTEKTIDKRIGFILAIATAILGCATAFYSVTARVAVLENRADQVEDNYKSAQDAATKYQELAQSIDSRLSKLEGALGVGITKK